MLSLMSLMLIALIAIAIFKALHAWGGRFGGLAALALIFTLAIFLVRSQQLSPRGVHFLAEPTAMLTDDLAPRTPEERKRLAEIRTKARQPDVMRSRSHNGEGFEIYQDGMIVHVSQGERELFRLGDSQYGRLSASSGHVIAQTPEEYDRLRNYRLASRQPDAVSTFHNGQGFETYPDGLVIHVDSGQRSLFREGSGFGDLDSLVAKRTAKPQPDIRHREFRGSHVIEVYPDGMRVIADQGGERRVLTMPGSAERGGMVNVAVGRPTARAERPTWFLIAVVATAIAAPLMLARRRRDPEQRSGAGWTAFGALTLVGTVLVYLWLAQPLGVQSVQQAAAVNEQIEADQTVEELWQEINQPKIPLGEANGVVAAEPASAESAASEQPVADAAPPEDADLPTDDKDSRSEDAESMSASSDDEEQTSVEDEAAVESTAANESDQQAGEEEGTDEQQSAVPADDEADAAQATAQEVGEAEWGWLWKRPLLNRRYLPPASARDLQAPIVRPDEDSEQTLTYGNQQLTIIRPGGEPRQFVNHEDQMALSDVPAWQEGKPSGSRGAPAWTKKGPQHVGEVAEVTVSSEYFVTEDECLEDITGKLLERAYDRVRMLVRDTYGEDASRHTGRLGLSATDVLRHLCVEQHMETKYFDSVGRDMQRLHILMKFDEKADEYLLQRWTTRYRQYRMENVSLIAAGVLGLMTLAFGLLKLDTWTRGYYTKRLFIGVPAAIMALLLLFASLVA